MTEIKSIIYYSLSGNTRAFAKRFEEIGYTVTSNRESIDVAEPFILFTPTYNFGEIPAPVERFLRSNNDNMVAVVSFGNMNWGEGYALAGEKVRDKYGVPLLMKVELRGSDLEFEKLREMMLDYGGIT